ncbi:MAG: glycoside hydrolase [Pedosphaera sp.]|nr:glycoside hydrolase [Pedosphaera sp.]
MKTLIPKLLLLPLLLLCHVGFAQNIKVLANHIGYEKEGQKRAVILGHEGDDIQAFKIIDALTGKEVFSGLAAQKGPVQQWKDWSFWTVDFSAVTNEGTYIIECSTDKGIVRSFPFLIQHDLLEKNTLSNVIYYFKGQRCSGLLDIADRHQKFEGGSTNTIDVHGGWYDATGDYGKHLSHLSFSTYFNPQQIPLADWSLLKTYADLDERKEQSFTQFKRRLLDEAMFGADYLVRVKNPSGSFYRSVGAPGPGKKAEDRRIAKEGKGFAIKTVATKNKFSIGDTNPISGQFPYEVGYRAGGGMAIAALARAGACDVSGQFSNADYLKAAKDAFAYLEQNNLLYANDGRENIVDDYCALLATTELYKATHDAQYRTAADKRAQNLMGRLTTSGNYTNYWRADDSDRPFFHAADAGMPVVSLLEYYDIADETTRGKVLATVRKAMTFELTTTEAVNNPFGYARQLVQSTNGNRRVSFFYPHDAETAPWWQGENARLSSLASAARLAANHFKSDPAFCNQLQAYAANQLNWILGLNPFDCCMLHGAGRNNAAYMFFESYEYNNAPGGIYNGITGGHTNPADIDFNLGFAATGKDEDWRWTEQWLPHAAWYLLAISVKH